MEGVEKGLLYGKEEGCVWGEVSGEGLEEKLVVGGEGRCV